MVFYNHWKLSNAILLRTFSGLDGSLGMYFGEVNKRSQVHVYVCYMSMGNIAIVH
jgi:hypothetical protein